MFEEVVNFSLLPHEGPESTWGGKSILLFNGVLTKTEVPGYVIERQFKYNEHYLIVTSYNCPFEESNEFILLNSNLKTISKRSVGNWYGSYWLKDVTPLNRNKLLINFKNDFQVVLKVVQIPFFKTKSFLILTNKSKTIASIVRRVLVYASCLAFLFYVFPVSVALILSAFFFIVAYLYSKLLR